MRERDLVDRLAAHRTLGAAPRAELEWVAAHGAIRRLDTGEILSHKGVMVQALHVVLCGRLVLFVDRGAGPTKLVEWREGDVTGLLPYSRLVTAPGDSKAFEPLELFSIPREHHQEMARECFELTSILVHTMVDRARMFTSNDLLNEKMISLGKLSAGLAHELNNPVAAIERCASMLEGRVRESDEATRGLAAARLSDEQIVAADAMRAACMKEQIQGVRSPLEQLDREEAISEWLVSHGLDTANAEVLADTDVSFESLALLVGAVERQALNAVLRWAVAGSAVRNLTSQIQDCSRRISKLVTAVKGFTHMDQANVAGTVDLGPSLGNTVAVLKAKAQGKSVGVTLELEAELPKVRGYAGELNQVWGNLIDNALDAAATGGRVEVVAAREDKSVVVRIRDDGPGIPAEIRDRVFDPFFTTKAMGEGTGLGLDIARRLTRHNDGSIDFESQPGRTEFRVTLPISDIQA